ncbi:MAG: hypothetical protein PHY56_00975 [Candidatus Omnitrophica bacterium]|jgi:hypothetical protein|nr:hypothetical protein [Candidatus Omnitrophota bacterium]
MENKLTEKLTKLGDKLMCEMEKAVDYITEHPIKTLVVGFVIFHLLKWFKED